MANTNTNILEAIGFTTGFIFESILDAIGVRDLYHLAIANSQLHHFVTTSDKYIYLKKVTKGSYRLRLIKTPNPICNTEINLFDIEIKRSSISYTYYSQWYFEPDLCINNFGNSKVTRQKISDFFNTLLEVEKEFEKGDESRIDCIITFESGLQFESEVVIDELSLESDLEFDFVNKIDFVKTKLNSRFYQRARKWFDQWLESFLSRNNVWTTTNLNLFLYGNHWIYRKHSYTDEYYKCVKCKKWASQ